VSTSHPGSITSVRGASVELAFEELLLLVKASPGGRELSCDHIQSLLHLLVDVVIQCHPVHREYSAEIWYQPERRAQRASGIVSPFRPE
jgi:type IV secretion system protein VirB11